MEDKVGRIFLLMLVFIPLSLVFAFIVQSPTLTFIASVLAVIPLARIIGFSTKELALQTSVTLGGFLSAIFGNIIVLMIATLALRRGLIEIVKASIIGSIIGNLLLLIGLSIFLGGLKYKEQIFSKESTGVSSTMLIIAVAGLAIPSVYALTLANPEPQHVQYLSDSVALVMALIYLAGLFFAYFTHNYIFDSIDEIRASREKPTTTKSRALMILLLATIFVAIEAQLLVGNIEVAASVFGLREFFFGAVIVAIITNIAEKSNAIHFAMENKINLSIEIGLSSAIQIALFVVPILVFISAFFHYGFLLSFTMFEVVSVMFPVMIINYLASGGKCNWLEGAQLITVYLIIASAFYFI
jgi:Ca2+:H+ antiporter